MKELLQEEHREKKMYAGADGDAVPEEFREARNKGLYYLQFSGKTENEMRKKLAEQGFSPASVEDAILFLKHYRYLDDEDYARRYVEKNGHKKSIRQMKFDLRQKGVSDDLVEMIFEDMEVDESAQILGLLRRKNYDPEEPDPAKRQKIYAFLARKGFSYDAINSAMKQWSEKLFLIGEQELQCCFSEAERARGLQFDNLRGDAQKSPECGHYT